jgi:hypothetical protein
MATQILPETKVEEGLWKPKIKVGLAVSPVDFSKVESAEVLPSHAKLDLDPCFSLAVDPYATPIVLVLQNQGRRVARFVKIRLRLVSFPGESPPVLRAKGFSTLSDETTLVFQGGADWVIYPHDMESFHLEVIGKPKLSFHDRLLGQLIMGNSLTDEQQRLLAITEAFTRGDYDFSCTVWAEGQDCPVKEELRLTIMDSKASERAEQLTQVIAQLESRRRTGTDKHSFAPGGITKDVP